MSFFPLTLLNFFHNPNAINFFPPSSSFQRAEGSHPSPERPAVVWYKQLERQ